MVWCIFHFYSANINFWYTGFFHRNLPMMAFSMLGVFLVYGMLMRKKKSLLEAEIEPAALVDAASGEVV
jgi:hypothetical protein